VGWGDAGFEPETACRTTVWLATIEPPRLPNCIIRKLFNINSVIYCINNAIDIKNYFLKNYFSIEK
jgi:hypothetical protein